MSMKLSISTPIEVTVLHIKAPRPKPFAVPCPSQRPLAYLLLKD